jgi:HD-GYP domain-containing protein (c-di-GMP phosphodiesterase class II)
VAEGSAPRGDQVRAAEVIAALCLATDLGTGLPFEHGLQSTLIASRLASCLGVDEETARQTYYACLLFYSGCTADAEVAAEIFDPQAMARYFNPVIFGSRAEIFGGILRAIAPPGDAPAVRAARIARRLPRAIRAYPPHLTALCEVAQMLTHRLGLGSSVSDLFVVLTERWDGKGEPGRLRGAEIPLALRIVHVARDAALHHALGGTEEALRVVRERSGGAFDPEIASAFERHTAELMTFDPLGSAWEETLASEPGRLTSLHEAGVDRALSAMGDFADLASPFFVGHSAGVAELVADAAIVSGFDAAEVVATRRAALVHEVGRVSVPVRVWQRPGPLTADEWERVRLHPYYTQRVLANSPFLSKLAAVATCEHERIDGSGYHRNARGPALGRAARLLAAADAYHALTEPRPQRAAFSGSEAAKIAAAEVRAGRLDGGAVAAVVQAASGKRPRIERAAGLTEREAQVIGLLARGLQTKQIARTLGISVKTADHHVQSAYGKIGVSTRAAAALFAMEHGLATWGELPIAGDPKPL